MVTVFLRDGPYENECFRARRDVIERHPLNPLPFLRHAYVAPSAYGWDAVFQPQSPAWWNYADATYLDDQREIRRQAE